MKHAKRTFSLMFVIAAAALWEAAVSAPALAQERDRADSRGRSERRQRARDGRGGPPGREHRSGLAHGRLPGANLFRSSPEDEGPLTDAEREELLAFARQHVPDICRRLRELRKRDPEAFVQRMQAAAPRLRQLRRIFERDAELGRSVVRHSENLHRMQRARRAWADSEHDPEARQRIQDLVRRGIAQNIRIETQVLEDRAQQLEEQREARIDAELEGLVSPDADLAGESDEVRDLVTQWHAAQSADERAALDTELRRLCFERMDREIKRLHARVARMRANTVAEVDRRLDRFISQAERDPRDDPGVRGRGRDLEDRGGEQEPQRGRRPFRRS